MFRNSMGARICLPSWEPLHQYAIADFQLSVKHAAPECEIASGEHIIVTMTRQLFHWHCRGTSAVWSVVPSWIRSKSRGEQNSSWHGIVSTASLLAEGAMCKFPVVFFSWNVRIGEIIPGVLPDSVRSYDARRRFRFRLLCLAFDNAVETHDVRDQKMKDDGATATQEIPQFSLDY